MTGPLRILILGVGPSLYIDIDIYIYIYIYIYIFYKYKYNILSIVIYYMLSIIFSSPMWLLGLFGLK